MSRVKSLLREEINVGDATDNEGSGIKFETLRTLIAIKVEMDESVNWKLICSNPTNLELRYARSQPFALGNRVIREYINVPAQGVSERLYKPENEDQFFFPQYKNSEGAWTDISATEDNASYKLTNGDNACNLYWTKPESIIMTCEAQ